MTAKGIPDNLKAAPMVYNVERHPSLTAQRIHLAQQAADLSKEDLEKRAAEAQVDLAGATTKEAMVEAARAQVRGADANKEI